MPSYSCWAMDMVRAGVMFSLREASCCKVDVVNGGAGWRFFSCRYTRETENCPFSTASTTAWASSAECSSIFFSRP